jgi:hypothetical protein
VNSHHLGGGLDEGAIALFAAAQGLLGAFAFGDIEIHAQGPHGAAFFVFEDPPPPGNPVHRAVEPDHAPLAFCIPIPHRLLDQTPNVGPVLLVNQIQKSFDGSWKSSRRHTVDRFHLGRPAVFVGLEIVLEGANLGRFLRQSEPLFAFPQRLLDALALGDIFLRAFVID